jgi:hypothetical protein
MKRLKTGIALLVAAFITLPAVGLASPLAAPAAQDTTSALERGWRTGYSDGYQAGYGDSVEKASPDFRSKDDYQRADRAYATVYGPLEDYKDGYQQGFEIGYSAGYERRGFDSTVPQGLKRRGTAQSAQQSAPVTSDDNDDSSTSSSNTVNVPATTGARGPIFIRRDTVLRVELLTNLSTEASQEGDRFQARVIEPAEYEGAMIDGRVRSVKRPGRVKGNSELQLSFEQIRMDNRFANLNAQVIEVVDTPGVGGDTGQVDPEGGVKGKDSSKRDVVKIGTSSAIGAIIGAIAGGGKGAAIGAAIGGAIGTGGVLSQRGKDIYLPQGQQLRSYAYAPTLIHAFSRPKIRALR